MENPNTWNKATRVIAQAYSKFHGDSEKGLYGHSIYRYIHDALEKEGLLVKRTEIDWKPFDQHLEIEERSAQGASDDIGFNTIKFSKTMKKDL